MNDTLRPDERAALRQIQSSKENLGLLKKGIGLAASATGFAGANRILPFLNKLVPSSLALQGLKKVDKKIGTFIEKTMENGFSGDSILDFLRDQFSQKAPEQKQTNPIQEFETNYPDIAQALSGYINQGQSPDSAAAILKNSSSFSKKINKLEKDVGKNFVDYVLELFGGSQQKMQQQAQIQQPQPQQQAQMQQPTIQQAQPMQPQSQARQQADPLFQALQQGDAVQVSQIAGVNQKQAENLIMKFNQSQGQQQQGQGQGAQALQAILQKINQRLGG